jgi:hypothetical protein
VAVKRPNVELHIEELVLHGFAPGDRQAITAAIEAELGRLLAIEGLPASFEGGASIGTLDAGSFEAGASERPSALGARVGRSVYQSLESRE